MTEDHIVTFAQDYHGVLTLGYNTKDAVSIAPDFWHNSGSEWPRVISHTI